jgi:AraC-like DNA-binding protein
MLEFYRKTAVVFLVLAVVTSLATYACIELSYLSDELLPAHKSAIPWTFRTGADAELGGSSSLSVNDSTYSLDFDFRVLQGVDYPYVSLGLLFENLTDPEQFVDLSNYAALTFNVLCKPHNVLSFSMHTFDDQVSNQTDFSTWRTPVEFFSCNDTWKQIEIDIKHMEVPEWWVRFHNIELSNRGYRLDQVLGISFGISGQSPLDTPSNVKISELTLQGRDRRYIYVYGFFAVLVWMGFIFWFFKYHTKYLIADIKERMRQNRQLLVYQKLSVEAPQKDRREVMLLQFMAREYANPDLSLESAIAKLKTNRTKINEILKKEFGLTFTSYLNKLRLTEAARLLSEKKGANISKIAYSVGYNNVTYFNKLFKNEYGCTPKIFKSIYKPNKSGIDGDQP